MKIDFEEETKNTKHYWLYVLRLEQGKYYVGVTTQTPEERMKQHINGFAGANWTKRYKPVDIFYKQDLGNCTYERAEKYETKVTRKYMKKYGLNNVRGGKLSDDVIYVIRFGLIFTKENWKIITYFIYIVIIFIAILLYLFINKK